MSFWLYDLVYCQGDYSQKLKLVGGFQNPYPIYDQNLQFSLPCLWPHQTFDTLFMTIRDGTVVGLLFMVLTIMMKKCCLASSKKHSYCTYWYSSLECKNDTLNLHVWREWPKLILPKQLKNHTLWGCTHLYNPYKGVHPGFIGYCIWLLDEESFALTIQSLHSKV